LPSTHVDVGFFLSSFGAPMTFFPPSRRSFSRR
jgi:hypothetical protein